MALGVYQSTVVDDKGEPVTDATIEVRSEGIGQPLVSLYSDRDGETPLGNPFDVGSPPFDGDGSFRFHAVGGYYQIKITSPNYDRTLRYVPIGLAAGRDALTTALRYRFSTVTTDQDPTEGRFQFDTDTLGEVTTIRIDNRNDDDLDLSALLDTFDEIGDSSDRGRILIQSEDGSALFYGKLTGSVFAEEDTDGEGFREIAVTPLASAGSFEEAQLCSIMHIPSGVDGEDGADGETTISGTPSAGQYARFTSGTAIEGVGKADTFNDIKQAATTSASGAVEKATAAEARASTDDKYIDGGLLASAASAAGALSESGGDIAINWESFIWDGEVEVDENFTILNPTNGKPGQHRQFIVKGNNSTERTGSVGNQFGGAIPDIVVTDTDKLLITIFCVTNSKFLIWANDAADA